jgi:hypothetical protein
MTLVCKNAAQGKNEISQSWGAITKKYLNSLDVI